MYIFNIIVNLLGAVFTHSLKWLILGTPHSYNRDAFISFFYETAITFNGKCFFQYNYSKTECNHPPRRNQWQHYLPKGMIFFKTWRYSGQHVTVMETLFLKFGTLPTIRATSELKRVFSFGFQRVFSSRRVIKKKTAAVVNYIINKINDVFVDAYMRKSSYCHDLNRVFLL